MDSRVLHFEPLNRISLRAQVPTSITNDGWEIPRSSIILEGELGEGCFSQVYRGFVKGPLVSSHAMRNSIYKPVAIKLLKCEFIVH